MRTIKPDRRFSLGLERACRGVMCGVGFGTGFGAPPILADTLRAPPDDMDLLDLEGFKASLVATNLDWDSFRPTGGTAIYVATTGDDSNVGDEAHPFRTLYKAQAAALATGTISTVHVAAGLYRRIHAYTAASSPRQSLAWIADGAVTVANIEEAASWTQNGTYETVWQTAQANAVQICSLDMLEDDEVTPKRLVKKTTLANCAAAIPEGTAGHWYTDGTNIYVQMPNGASPVDPSERVYVSITATSNIFVVWPGTTQHWDGFDFYGTLTVSGATVTRRVVFRDCTFRRGATNCVSVARITNAYFKDCTASYGGADGFNFHFSDETNYVRAVCENCTANANGTSGDTSNNGFTIHEAGALVMVNCHADGSYGNVNAHVTGSQVWALGCSSNNSYLADRASWQVTDASTMWLDTCTATGSTYDRSVDDDSKIYCYKFTGGAGQDYQAVGGVIDSYMPQRSAADPVPPTPPPASDWEPLEDPDHLHTWITTDIPTNTPDVTEPASWNILDNAGTIASPGPDYSNGTKATQPLQTALNSRAGCLFSTASQTYLIADAGYRTQNRILHNGVGCTLAFAIKFATAAQVQTILRNRGSSGAGFFITTLATARLSFSIVNAAGTVIYTYTGPADNQVGTSQVHLITYRFDAAQATDVDFRLDGVSISSGNVTDTPSDTDAGREMYIGATLSTSGWLDAQLPELIMFDRYYSDTEVADVEAYLRSRWGA